MQGHCASGTIDLGTRGPGTFVRGHIVSGRPVSPPYYRSCCAAYLCGLEWRRWRPRWRDPPPCPLSSPGGRTQGRAPTPYHKDILKFLKMYVEFALYSKFQMRWWDVPKRCVPVRIFWDESSPKHNVPALIHPCHFSPTKTYSIMHNDRDVSIQGHCVARDDQFGDQGSQNLRTGTHRFGTSRHPTKFYGNGWTFLFEKERDILFLGNVFYLESNKIVRCHEVLFRSAVQENCGHIRWRLF